MGIRLMSLVAYLDTIARMPVELIQGLLSNLFGLSLLGIKQVVRAKPCQRLLWFKELACWLLVAHQSWWLRPWSFLWLLSRP